MSSEIQNKIKLLSDSILNDPATFDAKNWAWESYLAIMDIVGASEWGKEEILKNLPPKIQTLFLLEDLMATINNDGFFSVFYNESLYAIRRLRHAIDISDLQAVGDLFDEAFRLVEGKFTWSSENINFVVQMVQMDGNVNPYEFFGSETTDRIEEIEKQVSDILFTDEFEKHLESYIKS